MGRELRSTGSTGPWIIVSSLRYLSRVDTFSHGADLRHSPRPWASGAA
jgi:hypothetical protein